MPHLPGQSAAALQSQQLLLPVLLLQQLRRSLHVCRQQGRFPPARIPKPAGAALLPRRRQQQQRPLGRQGARLRQLVQLGLAAR